MCVKYFCQVSKGLTKDEEAAANFKLTVFIDFWYSTEQI